MFISLRSKPRSGFSLLMIHESSEQMSSSALDSPSSYYEPPTKFTDDEFAKIKDPSKPSTIPDHISQEYDAEYQVYLNLMKELLNWQTKFDEYENSFEKLDRTNFDALKFTYQENLIPFIRHVKNRSP
jgi:hypothetical protein